MRAFGDVHVDASDGTQFLIIPNLASNGSDWRGTRKLEKGPS